MLARLNGAPVYDVWSFVSVHPIEAATGLTFAFLVGYVAMTLYLQHREEVAFERQYRALTRERDHLLAELRGGQQDKDTP